MCSTCSHTSKSIKNDLHLKFYSRLDLLRAEKMTSRLETIHQDLLRLQKVLLSLEQETYASTYDRSDRRSYSKFPSIFSLPMLSLSWNATSDSCKETDRVLNLPVLKIATTFY